MNPGFSNVVKACGMLVSAWMVACSGAVQHPALAGVETVRTCPGGEVTSDAEVQTLAGCDEVHGDLRISGVTSVEALSSLREVHGTLTLANNPELSNLEGLEGLTRVDTLVLDRNGFYTVDALDGLHEIGRLAIVANPKLISVAGLNQVRNVREIVIAENPRLSAHYGLLPALEHNPTRVAVENNRGLSTSDVDALSRL